MRKVYRGKDIEVSFDLDICIHIGECLRAQPKVFDLNRRLDGSAAAANHSTSRSVTTSTSLWAFAHQAFLFEFISALSDLNWTSR